MLHSSKPSKGKRCGMDQDKNRSQKKNRKGVFKNTGISGPARMTRTCLELLRERRQTCLPTAPFVFGGSVLMPGPDTDNALFDGVKFKDLPTVHIKAAWNNTILSVTNGPGDKVFYSTSCGVEGFKNAKKGTNIAAQSTGINCATRCVSKGIRTVRVVVNGIGPGRMSAVKGLQMGGFNIVSLSDDTYYNTNKRGPRPRSI